MIAASVLLALAVAVEPPPPAQSPPTLEAAPPPAPEAFSPAQQCFRPRSNYVATSTGEVVSTAVAGGYMVALRYGRRLPYDVKLLPTDLGNWTIAIGRIGCRSVTMFEGFRGVGKVDEDGVIDWADPMDEWQPSPTWSEWFYGFLASEDTRVYDEPEGMRLPEPYSYDDDYDDEEKYI